MSMDGCYTSQHITSMHVINWPNGAAPLEFKCGWWSAAGAAGATSALPAG